MSNPHYMTIREVMDHLRVSRDTVEKMLRNKQLRYQRMHDDARNPIRVYRQDVYKILPLPQTELTTVAA